MTSIFSDKKLLKKEYIRIFLNITADMGQLRDAIKARYDNKEVSNEQFSQAFDSQSKFIENFVESHNIQRIKYFFSDDEKNKDKRDDQLTLCDRFILDSVHFEISARLSKLLLDDYNDNVQEIEKEWDVEIKGNKNYGQGIPNELIILTEFNQKKHFFYNDLVFFEKDSASLFTLANNKLILNPNVFVHWLPVSTRPVQSVIEEPVQSVIEEPVQSVVEEPVQSVVEEPVQSVVEEPVQSVVEEPVQPVVEEPVQPVVEEPGKPEKKHSSKSTKNATPLSDTILPDLLYLIVVVVPVVVCLILGIKAFAITLLCVSAACMVLAVGLSIFRHSRKSDNTKEAAKPIDSQADEILNNKPDSTLGQNAEPVHTSSLFHPNTKPEPRVEPEESKSDLLTMWQ